MKGAKRKFSIILAFILLVAGMSVVSAENYIHEPYISGYENGYFGPDNYILRSEVVHIFAGLWSNSPIREANISFLDISSDDWFYEDVKKAVACGFWEDGEYFYPGSYITRAELAKMVSPLINIEKYPENTFRDVSPEHNCADAIYSVCMLEWMYGFDDGTFRPDSGVSRAEAVFVINRAFGYIPDKAEIDANKDKVKTYPDVTPDRWYYYEIIEATTRHEMFKENNTETWVKWLPNEEDSLKLPIPEYKWDGFGFWVEGEDLYYIDAKGEKLKNKTLGAFKADADGKLTKIASEYRVDVPYLSQIDGINAWVGCEPTAALAGLIKKGFARDVTLESFLDNIPKTTENPEIGFVGDPYTPDPTKRTRTTIYPAKLAEYCNSYCVTRKPCSDIRGYSVEQLQNELLIGNFAVAYMTLRWVPINYRNFLIEGATQRLVSNNHAVLVCGYSPEKGYWISDPYNDFTPGKPYQYWMEAETFERIWNERKVAMIIR